MKDTHDFAMTLIGKPYEEAKALAEQRGLVIRRTSINGKACVGTRDWRRDRINVSVVDGQIDGIRGIG